MPIKDLSDKKTLEQGYRFPVAGVLAKGGVQPARGSGKEQPHWRYIERMPGSKAAFEAVYKKEPTELADAALAYPTQEQCFESWVECREPGKGGRFLWRSDGERSVIRWIEKEKRYTAKAGEQLPHDELPDPKKWAQNKGRLYVRLVGLAKAGFSQPVMLTTGGINDIVRIARFLHGLWEEQERLHGQNATLEHYLVTLWRFEMQRSDPTSGNRYPHWDIGIARSPLYMQGALLGAREQAVQLASGSNIRLLDVETGEFINAEADYPDDDLTEHGDIPERGKHAEFDGGGGHPGDWTDEPRHEHEEQDIADPSVVGGQGAEMPPEPKPPAEKKPKAKRTPKAEPPPEPPAESSPLLDALEGLDYDPEAKAASLSGDMNKWREAATKLAEDCPVSFAASGKPDFPKMLKVAGGLGYPKVSTDILDEVMDKLREWDEKATAEQNVPF